MTETAAPFTKQSPWPVLAIFLVGLIVLCAANSSALLTATYDLAPGAVSERLIGAAEGWHGGMEDVGIAEWRNTVEERLQEWRSDTRLEPY